jgi:26S proteasome regulatory subunit N2
LKEICGLIKRIGQEQNIDSEKLNKLVSILEGNVQRNILDYTLNKMNKSDPAVMKGLMKSVEKGGSIAHLAVILANSMINSHTKNDSFLKENIEWCAKATNWARFTATSSLGAIHMGNVSKGLEVMKPYMPGSTTVPSVYAQAGSYYGLGLIYANTNNQEILKLLLDALSSPSSSKDTMQHGLYLAIGLVAMCTHDAQLYERLRDGMYTDDAVIGEAATLAIGLVMIGSKNEQAIEDLVTYSHDTQHEKIIRAISMSLALIMYETQEAADSLIEQLSREKDPILRYGAMFTIGLAYAGTGNTSALKKLIKFSVSDVNDDVRRAALINIGFLHIKNPETLLENMKVLSLLSESYNPHVRYGAALSLGIACAGTSMINAYNIIQPLFTDSNYLVRQGALLATSLIFSQTTTTQEPKLSTFKETLDKVAGDKDEHVLVRFGGILSLGITELGGRNSTLKLVSNSGNNRMGAIIGMALFTQYYYWFPMIHFIHLAVSPTMVLGVDSNLKLVKNFKLLSKAKPSVYGYPKEIKIEEKKDEKKTAAAVLSTHSRVKAKERRTGTITSIMEPMDVERQSSKIEEPKPTEEKPAEKQEEKPVEEPSEEVLENPTRILPKQMSVISVLPNQDYVPLLSKRLIGFTVLRKVNQNAEPQYFEEEKPATQPSQVDQNPTQNQSGQGNNYQPLATHDVEMPEEFDA